MVTWFSRTWGLMEDCRVFGVYSFSFSLCQQADTNSPPAQLKLKDLPGGLRGRRGCDNHLQLHGWRERKTAQQVVSELDNTEGKIRDAETTTHFSCPGLKTLATCENEERSIHPSYKLLHFLLDITNTWQSKEMPTAPS